MFESIDLNLVWFILIGILFSGYAILDGFDLGTGTVYPFIKGDINKRYLLNAVGPVWDGNEVWLIVGGGALFAAFPFVYATVFSGFYLAFMLLLLALILRAVSIEFRSQQPWNWWRKTWGAGFSTGSIMASILIGVAMGNITRGIPLDTDGNYTGTFLELLNPYSILLGVTTLFLFAMHGCIYLIMKTEGETQEQVKKILRPCMFGFIVLIILHTIVTLLYIPHAREGIAQNPWILILVFMAAASIAMIPVFMYKGYHGWAFLSSVSTMGCMMSIFGATMFPHLVYCNTNPELSLTLYNASATTKSLEVMTVIALIGVPLVLAYSAAIYWVFRGKVVLTERSY